MHGGMLHCKCYMLHDAWRRRDGQEAFSHNSPPHRRQLSAACPAVSAVPNAHTTLSYPAMKDGVSGACHTRSSTSESLCSTTAASEYSSGFTDGDFELRFEDRTHSLCSSTAPTEVEQDPSYAELMGSGVSIQRETHWCTTSDGWNLHLLHVTDPSQHDDPVCSRRRPVLLVPGLASSGVYTFDLDPSISLAQHLALLGWDVWVPDLRGNGFSDKPTRANNMPGWTVDTYLQVDIPAVLDYVLEATQHTQVHWIGHSMGGMLACGLLSSCSAHAAALASITTLASGCFGAGSWHSYLKGVITAITDGWGFPAGHAANLLGLLTGTRLSLALFEVLFFWRSNMPVPIQKKLLSSCFNWIPTGVIQQFMGSLNTPEGISAADGKFKYADPEVLKMVNVPIMGLTGDWDLFCPPSGGYKTIQCFGSSNKKFIFLGPGYGTTKDHYGHFDVVAGARVGEEVYPHIVQWLDQQEA